jgi:hypothetical protein
MKKLSYLLIIISIISCTNAINISDQEWSINDEFIREGCFNGKDCIPSIDSPNFSNINSENIEFIDEEELIVGIWDGDQYIAFPHSILDWHEIVNGNGYSISYCPLTGSALNISMKHEFGVSGMLFNSNLIMYDRQTDSLWPQMLLKSASGNRIDEQLKIKPILETTWANWKKLYPDSKVLNSNTGFNRDYDKYPYGEYKTCNSSTCQDYIYFPVENQDNRLPAKERVLTIINNETAHAVRINSNIPKLFSIDVNSVKHVVIISGKENIAISFKTDRNLKIEKWDISSGKIILFDENSGEKWNILGVSISNSNTDNLIIANSYIAYWFSVAAFFPDIEIID